MVDDRWMTWGFGSNRFPKVGSLWVTRRTISPSSPPPLPLVIPRGVPPRATSSHSDYALWQLHPVSLTKVNLGHRLDP
jgi:hypothetical protein